MGHLFPSDVGRWYNPMLTNYICRYIYFCDGEWGLKDDKLHGRYVCRFPLYRSIIRRLCRFLDMLTLHRGDGGGTTGTEYLVGPGPHNPIMPGMGITETDMYFTLCREGVLILITTHEKKMVRKFQRRAEVQGERCVRCMWKRQIGYILFLLL
ncbi:hypothetical protein K504DRAFT_163718 [Pleomassaria siparia CBS 279.74]|uniref:Uncharacterized protein n=1 Tax=Pleomassaria siparia CBS 279.74 TaxID=1314801 RepID=A0A6G1JUU9_9PLEO|nr:hypothetical protein K504DRAFT_163718 [Pleomassaria siparia CBS 279.74]